MIQVCSGCGTRWNVRDRQRAWCPRCQGALHAPMPDQPKAAPARSGFRWIAVRPGAAPTVRRHRRGLSPTPRYYANPGWGLHDYPLPEPAIVDLPAEPSPARVSAMLRITAIVLAVAAAVYALRYVLLVINRDTLLHPVVATAGVWLGVLASFAVLATLIACAVLLTRWLIARRAAGYAHRRRTDPRPAWLLWAGCLVPVLNLAWAPVFVIETAMSEGIYSRLRKPIALWWLLWVLSTLLAVFAMVTSVTVDAQGIADNTVTTTLAYLLALAVVVALTRVYHGFVQQPVDRPAHRWVVVGAESPDHHDTVVEPRDREPAA